MSLIKSSRRMLKFAGIACFAAAIGQEMLQPESKRKWHGRVFGFVPYDFRPPTYERITKAFWNTEDDRIFTDRPWGVGWAVNLFRIRQMMGHRLDNLVDDKRVPDVVRRAVAVTGAGTQKSRAAVSAAG